MGELFEGNSMKNAITFYLASDSTRRTSNNNGDIFLNNVYISSSSSSSSSSFEIEDIQNGSGSGETWSTTTNNLTTTATSLLLEQPSEQELPIDMQFNNGHLLAIVGYSVLMIFSAVGNISVLYTIVRVRQRQGRLNAMNLLLLHLCTADLLVTFLIMPLEIGWNATVSWQAGDILCRVFSFTRIFGLYLSGFILMCISVDRYYAIVHPLSITQSSRRCRIMLITAWICSAVCSAPQAVIFHVERHPTFRWYQQCITFHSFPTPDYELAYNFFVFAVLYAVPLTTIVACYARILLEIWKINSRGRREEEQLRRSTIGSFGRAKARTFKMTLMILATYLFCWLPYWTLCIWYWLDSQSASQVDQRVQKGLFLFACTNSCMNPLIYGLFHFRRKHRAMSTGVAAIGGSAVAHLMTERFGESITMSTGRGMRRC